MYNFHLNKIFNDNEIKTHKPTHDNEYERYSYKCKTLKINIKYDKIF